MTVLKVGFVGIRSDRLDETVALFRDVMGVPVTRQTDDLVGFRLADGSVLELYGPTNEFHAFFTTGPVVAFRVEPRRRCKSAIDFNLRYDALAAVVEHRFDCCAASCFLAHVGDGSCVTCNAGPHGAA